MEISKKKITKIIEIWDCGMESHRHKTKEAAIHCNERQPRGSAKSMTISHYQTILRNTDIFERLVVNGEARKSIAKEYGLQESTITLISKQLGGYSLYSAGIIPRDHFHRGLREWKQNKDEASDFIKKIRNHATYKLQVLDKK